jgi:hypothetical protein
VLPSPITLEWQACSDPDKYVINVSVNNTNTWEEILDEELPGNATELGTPVSLSSDDYEIDLSFDIEYNVLNEDGIPVELQKWTESDYLITITE